MVSKSSKRAIKVIISNYNNLEELQIFFDKVYQTNYPKVIRLCMGYVNGDAAKAKDLAQEVFIKAWENLGSFRKESGVSTWIYRITVNTCLLQLRNQKIKKSSNERVLEHITEEVEENKTTYEVQLKSMYACINKLSKENKSIILLELEGLPQKNIAEITGYSHESVRVRIHRIKNELTKCVKL